MKYDPYNRIFRDTEKEITQEEILKIEKEKINNKLNSPSPLEIRIYGSVNELMDDWINRGWLHKP